MDRFRRMVIFVAVVEAGQLTRASEALHLSKSAVSHALTDLERYLGLQLILRNNRSFQLTGVGQTYYEDCKRILADVQDVEDQIRGDDKRVSGNIRITAPYTFGSYLLTPILSQFIHQNPAISLDLSLTERQVDLTEEGFDIAFRIQKSESSQLICRHISTVQMVICASPSYLINAPALTTHQDLKIHNCLRYVRSPSWSLSKDGRNFEIMPEGNISTNSGENLREFLIAGQGVGYLPYFLAHHALEAGTLVEVLPDYKGLTLNCYIVRPIQKHCPARVHNLVEFVASHVVKLEPFLTPAAPLL